MIDDVVRWDLLATAGALNALYLGAGFAAFLLTFQRARRSGLLLNVGE
jgi:hypothetical protein